MSVQTINQQLENMSVYIPHVFTNFTAEYIAGVFENLGIGMVDHVDLVAKLDKQGKPYNAAYVHFKYWCSGPAAEDMYYRIKDERQEARIVHDDPWYWILLENTAKKYEPAARKPCINIAPTLDIAPGLDIAHRLNIAPGINLDDELEQQAEIEAAIEFFENEAAELELQNELFLEDENRLLHEQNAAYRELNRILEAENAELKEKNADLKEEIIDLYDKIQVLEAEGNPFFEGEEQHDVDDEPYNSL